MTSSKPEVVAIFGPTASGKTAVSQRVATELATEVVSADALQVYRGLPILTNQPETPTRLVAIRDLSQEFSVGEYASLAHAAIDGLVDASAIAVVSGGTGLYFRAALVDLELPPSPENGTRARWEKLYDENPVVTFAQLTELDPIAASLIHRNDRRRVVRALELAENDSSLAPVRSRLWSRETRRPTLVVGLDLPPESLKRRIRERTAEMFRRGAVAEARRATAGAVSRTAEKALGLRELTTLSEGEAFERLVMRTRRYSAYQRKWMRRIDGIVMLDGDRHSEEVARAILDLVRAG